MLIINYLIVYILIELILMLSHTILLGLMQKSARNYNKMLKYQK